jgi:hypothetical protein
MNEKKVSIVVFACILFISLAFAPPAAASQGTTQWIVPAEEFPGFANFFNPCYLDGGATGEKMVNPQGYVRLMAKELNDGYMFSLTAVGLRFTGEISGATYHFNGGLHQVSANGGNSYTYIHNGRLVSPGNPGYSWQLRHRVHITVTPNGVEITNPYTYDHLCK